MAIKSSTFKFTSDVNIVCGKCSYAANLKGSEHPYEFDDEKTIEENFENRPLVINCPKCGIKILELLMHWESLDNEDKPKN